MSIFNFRRKKEADTIIYQLKKTNIEYLSVYTATDTGKVRRNNEDNYFADEAGTRKKPNEYGAFIVSNEYCRVFAVCDGMGGESYGDVASQIAVETFPDFMELFRNSDSSSYSEIVNRYASEANNRICDMTLERKCNRSGCTLAMVCICDNMAYVYNIGDSRVYFMQNNQLLQITEDQTLAVKKLKANIYTREEARTSPDAHKITSFVGVDDRKIGLRSLAYKPLEMNGGTFLICSDGLTDMCSDKEIADILGSDAKNPAKALVDKALKNGGADNVTCIVIRKQNYKEYTNTDKSNSDVNYSETFMKENTAEDTSDIA